MQSAMTPADKHHEGRSKAGSSAHGATTPEATYVQVDQVSSLVSRLSELLAGSTRCVAAAKNNVEITVSLTGHAAAAEACTQLNVVADQLERMSELVHAAMQNSSQPIGSPALARSRPVTLAEAVSHAMDVVRPLATRHGVDVECDLDSVAVSTPAGGLYTVVLNGLQNAVESVARRGGAGRVLVTLCEVEPPARMGRDDRSWFEFTIRDDGIGPPNVTDPSRVFDMGFTTKTGGAGIGLAVARSVVQSMNGSIELLPADSKQRAGRRGAVLRVRFPSPASRQ
jgi:signal transduction histidine kinase